MGSSASPLAVVERHFGRLAEAPFIENIDVYHRPLRDVEDDQASIEPVGRSRT